MREFASQGYKGFVINEVCKVDGISKGVLYHNFSGKADLYLACVQESFEKSLAIFRGEMVKCLLWLLIWKDDTDFIGTFQSIVTFSLRP
ncbi:TetR/AcrR family transcriptional regulator [Streptococcus suis]|uniref:TetR/AcrR family transcriptional regulator n=1 Tax=Streptococcus suis TaxID=1307 RepID=UPI00211DB23E|nr:TetR/AcrR family transcriptional regulator [Streptococcus suis]